MKRILMMALLALSLFTVHAQTKPGTFSIIPKVGFSLSNMTGQDVLIGSGSEPSHSIKTTYRSGLVIGADVQYMMTEKFGLSLGVLYSREGFRMPNFQDESEHDGIKNVFMLEDGQLNLDYLSAPILAHYYITDHLCLNAGFQIGFLLSARMHQVTTSYDETDGTRKYEQYEGKDLNHLESNNSWSAQFEGHALSIPVGLSYEYQNIVLDAKYNFPVSYVNKAGYDKNILKTFLFTVGYKFDL